ncbi:MAG: XdhC family protein [Chloroflexi bacterium]|nr:XdhC family protein [Chloroflexota bacterium]
MAAHVPAVLATLVGDAGVPPALLGRKLLVRADGYTVGTMGSAAADAVVRDAAERLLAGTGPTTELLRVPIATMGRHDLAVAPDATLELYVELYQPRPRLVVVGAGHIGLALAALGRLLDFEVVVLDDRPEYANRERFPEVDQVLAGPYVETLGRIDVTPSTFVVLVTRGHRHDMECLKLVAERPAGYIGMIGSRRRVGAVLRTLEDEGFPREVLQRIATPIGIDIGAETPAEIAVSIFAEIVHYRRRGSPSSVSLSRIEHIPTFARRRREGTREGIDEGAV